MNISGVLELFEELPEYKKFLAQLQTQKDLAPLQLPQSVRPPILAKTFLDRGRSLLFITGRVDAVPVWQQALEAWLPEGCQLIRFPEPTPLPYERGPWSKLSRTGRLETMTRLMEAQHPLISMPNEPLLIVTSARAFLQKTMPRRRFVASTRLLRTGQIIELEKVVEEWQQSGYTQVSVVETVGQFSRRGGILDIFPVGNSSPVRIELFGDEIDTLRSFDPATQRSEELDANNNQHIVIPPARELLPGDAKPLGRQLVAELNLNPEMLPGWQDDVENLVAGTPSPNLEYYLPMVYAQPASLLDYLPDDAWVVIDDYAELESAVRDVQAHALQIAGEQVAKPPDFPNPLFQWPEMVERLTSMKAVVLGDGDSLYTAGEPRPELADLVQPGPRYGGQTRPLIMQLKAAVNQKQTTIVVSRQSARLAELWRESESAFSSPGLSNLVPIENLAQRPEQGQLLFIQGSLSSGFSIERPGVNGRGIHHPDVYLNLLTDAEIFGWSRPTPRRRTRPRPVAPETFYADIAPGDFVVHTEFGIGEFAGLVIRLIGGTEREYLQVNYGNSDVLYVPVHHADRLSKWIGPDDRQPAFNRLGEKHWRKAKAKAQEAVDELADELLELYAVRETISGHAFAPDTPWQMELEASFPYRETEDQILAITEVKADMERQYPMDRLICGDVGYGKTEVGLRAAFKAVMDGKQVALLVPTTVLAQQHYNTFVDRLKPFPVNVEMLSRFRTPAQQERILHNLREGQVDIVIGTHRLFSEDVSFKDLGLLLIDEEQRFGVAHKEKLKQLRTEVDVLTLTATPIPRTLYMSLAGVRDISIIDTAPADRLPVQTYVGEADDTLIRRAILRELDRGGQIFYVHNRVQTIANVQIKLMNLIPEAIIAIGHGQMSERELEDVMLGFVNGEVDVLLTTTIIESGLDIPNANTLIVDRADMFGLAQLYQLRGRVGRGVRQAYAYFLHPAWKQLTADAKTRLEVIGEQTELGAGYSIAMRDLEIRGAGDLLGARQSGHIAAIGFDLYTRLLTQAVKQRKAAKAGKPIPTEIPDGVLVDLPLAAYVPTDFVPDASLRLRLYRRMSIFVSLAEIDDMAEELADRFGPIPDPVDNLLYQLRIKIMAKDAIVAAVTSEASQIQVRLPGEDTISQLQLQRILGPEVRVSRRGIWLGRNMSTREWKVTLVQVLEKIQALRAKSSVH